MYKALSFLRGRPWTPRQRYRPRRTEEGGGGGVADRSLEYVVITSVTRDDLLDGGASHFAETMSAIKRRPEDVWSSSSFRTFEGDMKALQGILQAAPDVLGHNIEVVRRLQAKVRDRMASYERSLALLQEAKMVRPEVMTKSSLMLGLGETEEEVHQCLQDLVHAKVDILTVGQYLRPGPDHLPVERYPRQRSSDR